jgi:DNA (cytosine-5)-methyltransferase 1
MICEVCGKVDMNRKSGSKTCGAACRKRLSRMGGKCDISSAAQKVNRRCESVTLEPGSHVDLEQLKRDISTGANLRLLDLFCGCGGCSVGYAMAGFYVVGVDIEAQPYYPFEFIQGDALKLDYEFLMSFDVIVASPPCQEYSRGSIVARKKGKKYPDLYLPVKRMLVASGKPYVIENVIGSPAKGIRLCGDMFGLQVIRDRIFESNLSLSCDLPRNRVGSVKTGEYVTVAGVHKRRRWAAAMGIHWANTKGIRQAIPPVYTAFIGKQIHDKLRESVTLSAAPYQV